jgi:phosphatidylglycerophosphate synthase
VESIAELRRICQADKLQRSRGLTRLNRFVSIYATFAALSLGVSANALTVLSIAVGLLGAVLLASSGYTASLSGVGLLYLSFLLDQVDGEVARYHRTTVTGAYLDEIRHVLIYASPIFAVSVQLLLAHPTGLMAAAGFAAAVGLIILRFNTNAHYLLLAKKVLTGPGDEGVRQASSRPVDDRRSATRRPSFVGRLKLLAGDAIAGLTYLTTNQVSLLFLLLAYVHVRHFVADRSVHETIFLSYAGAVVALTVLGMWKMAYWGRIEKSCAEIAGVMASRTSR